MTPARSFVTFCAAMAAGFAAAFSAAAAAKPSDPVSPFAVEEATIPQIQTALLEKRVTTVQLVEAYLRRIKAYNGTCVKQPQGILGPVSTIPHAGQINALVTLNLRPASLKGWGFDARKARSLTDPVDADPRMPDALEVAAEQDRAFAATGKLVGPLHGVIMAIKDQYDTFDLRTTSGADVDYANDRPPEDSTFVQKLREAGAIILAKSNLGEYASGIPRSSYGGTFCNPYDTERSPRGSSSGSGSAVGANLVTCAIAEESGSSIRGPASAASSVGIAATEELVSRKGMVQIGINTRVGPICRTVGDAARILDVIAGYDPKDELTVFTLGRMPSKPYASYAMPGSLDGLRIGVAREYMRKSLLTSADAQTVDIVSRGVEDLRKLGATIVDPGPEGELFTACLRRYAPQSENKLFTKKYPELFPVDAAGKPTTDHSRALLAMRMDPSKVPEFTLRDFGGSAQDGQNKYFMDLYLAERGDTNVKTNADLITKARFHQDPTFPDRKRARENAEKIQEYNMAERLLRRFSVQQLVLQCMAEQKLDAIVYPTASLPPKKLGSPAGPAVNGRRGSDGVWTFIGAQGFPAITVPAGFTTEVYDLIRDPDAPKTPESAFGADGGGGERLEGDDRTRLVGPVKAELPVAMDIAGKPFDEPTLLRIAAAYEAATMHRRPPPEFGPLSARKKK
jgi:Asp-tRNA(Asn)/Glu-tRNA(Gln) amidotransferase A subunit family amidase